MTSSIKNVFGYMRNRKGATLLELAMVIAILGAMVSIVVPQTIRNTEVAYRKLETYLYYLDTALLGHKPESLNKVVPQKFHDVFIETELAVSHK